MNLWSFQTPARSAENSMHHSVCPASAFSLVRLTLALVLLRCETSFAVGTEPQYSAKGRLEAITRSTPLDQPHTNYSGFFVEVTHGRYKIRITLSGSTNQYYEYAFDNGTMTLLHHVGPATRQTAASGASPPAMFPARIETRESPPNDGSRAQFVWLALASQNVFAEAKSHMFPIWFPEDPTTRRQPVELRIYYDLLEGSAGLPSRLIFLNEGSYCAYNPARRTVDVLPLVPPYDRGFTNAVYQVLALTNTPRWSLPREFVFVAYSSPVGAGEVPFERIMLHGFVDEAGEMTNDYAKIAKFTGTASVVDFRMSGAVHKSGRTGEYQYAAYPVTNAQWLASNQLSAVRHRIEKNIFREQAAAINSPSRIVLLKVIIVLIAFVALPIFWRLFRRKV